MNWWIPLAIITAISVARFVFTTWRGDKRAIVMLMSGEFDRSPQGQVMAKWFEARPRRNEQRRNFVGFALAVGVEPVIVSVRLMDCFLAAADGQHQFGDLLAKEIGNLIVFDPPQNDEEQSRQDIGKASLAEFQAELRLLDEVLTSERAG